MIRVRGKLMGIPASRARENSDIVKYAARSLCRASSRVWQRGFGLRWPKGGSRDSFGANAYAAQHRGSGDRLRGGVVALVASAPVQSPLAAGSASDGPGDTAAWTTGNKLAVGTSADTTSKVWFTVANGITSEIFYPRLDVPNMQDMQYIVTDGSTFVDLERDATDHVVSMPDEKALEYTVTNTDKRATPKYRITNTYITDPSRNTLLIRTRFQSLDGGTYRLYLLENPSMAGGGANDNAWWDAANAALLSSGTETLFGSLTTVVSALKVASPNGFVAHDNGYAGMTSDCYVDLSADQGAQQPVRQHCRQWQRCAVWPGRQRRHRYHVHHRARLRQ